MTTLKNKHQTTTNKNRAPRGSLAKLLYIKNKEESPGLKAAKRVGKHPGHHGQGTQSIGASWHWCSQGCIHESALLLLYNEVCLLGCHVSHGLPPPDVNRAAWTSPTQCTHILVPEPSFSASSLLFYLSLSIAPSSLDSRNINWASTDIHALQAESPLGGA